MEFGGPQGIELLQNSWHFLQAAEEVVRAEIIRVLCTSSESVSPFHLFYPFIDWLELVGLFVFCLLGLCVCVCLCLFLVADQSLRSSCPPMTILAQPYDCHSFWNVKSGTFDGEFWLQKKHVDLKKVTFGRPMSVWWLLHVWLVFFFREYRPEQSFFGPKKEVPFGSPSSFFWGRICRVKKNKLDGVVPISGYSSKVAKPLDDTEP